MSIRSDDLEGPSSPPPRAADPAAATLLPGSPSSSPPRAADPAAATLLPGSPSSSPPCAANPTAKHDLGDTNAPHDAADAAATLLPSPPGYEILQELGRGGMGVVYQARQLGFNRVVALKMILSGSYAGPDVRDRFRIEAQAVARLQHPNIVQVYEVGEHEGRPFFSMEFCPGGGLDTKLNGTPMPPAEAARLVETLARAVQAAHDKGVVHRDLKPANVLMAEDGAPKVTDFGLAKRMDEVGLTVTGAVMGTPSYMAPEQAGGKSKEIGPACDVYALGAILYECLTGRAPFKGPTAMDTMTLVLSADAVPPRQLQVRTPRDLDTICLKCLEKQAARRYATATALADDLGRWLRGEPVRAKPRSWLDGLRRLVRRRRKGIALAAAGSLLLLVGYIGLIDAGYRFPGWEAVQGLLDSHEASVFRRPVPESEVYSAATRIRRQLAQVLQERRTEEGWIMRNQKKGPEAELSIWAHSQALFAVLKNPDASVDELRSFVPGLELPFGSTNGPLENAGRKYGWLAYYQCDYTMAEPALWLSAAEAAALAKPHLLNAAERDACRAHLAYTQAVLDAYREQDTGGWNMFPDQKPLSDHDPYTTVLALQTLLEMRQADFPWGDSPERRDALLASTAHWLIEQYKAEGSPPGWTTSPSTAQTADGLTLQVFTTLLRAHEEANIPLPPQLCEQIPRHLNQCANRTLDFPINTGQVSRLFTDHTGRDRRAMESVNFLWYPWAVDASVRWLRLAAREGAPTEEVVQVRRVLAHLVCDLGEEAARRAGSAGTFMAAETLYGLSAVPPLP